MTSQSNRGGSKAMSKRRAATTTSVLVEKSKATGKQKAKSQQVDDSQVDGEDESEIQRSREARTDRYDRRVMAKRIREEGLNALSDQTPGLAATTTGDKGTQERPEADHGSELQGSESSSGTEMSDDEDEASHMERLYECDVPKDDAIRPIEARVLAAMTARTRKQTKKRISTEARQRRHAPRTVQQQLERDNDNDVRLRGPTIFTKTRRQRRRCRTGQYVLEIEVEWRSTPTDTDPRPRT